MNCLDKLAIAALKHHGGDIEKARPEFLRSVRAAKLVDDWAREFLHRIVEREAGQGCIETHSTNASLTPPLTPAQGSVKVKPYDVMQHRRRTRPKRKPPAPPCCGAPKRSTISRSMAAPSA